MLLFQYEQVHTEAQSILNNLVPNISKSTGSLYILSALGVFNSKEEISLAFTNIFGLTPKEGLCQILREKTRSGSNVYGANCQEECTRWGHSEERPDSRKGQYVSSASLNLLALCCVW